MVINEMVHFDETRDKAFALFDCGHKILLLIKIKNNKIKLINKIYEVRDPLLLMLKSDQYVHLL